MVTIAEREGPALALPHSDALPGTVAAGVAVPMPALAEPDAEAAGEMLSVKGGDLERVMQGEDEGCWEKAAVAVPASSAVGVESALESEDALASVNGDAVGSMLENGLAVASVVGGWELEAHREGVAG